MVLQQFITKIEESIAQDTFVKLTWANKRNKDSDVRTVIAKQIDTKKGRRLSLVARTQTQDTTKNYTIEEAISLAGQMLKEEFYQAILFTTEADWHISISRKDIAKLKRKAATITELPSKRHDKAKNRMIEAKNVYLHELGITTAEGKVRNNKQDKYRQINKYVEIIDGIMRSADMDSSFHVVDMGAGKGYLTFALYDYLQSIQDTNATVTGVEMRPGLVDTCNTIAQKANFNNLSFKAGTIQEVELSAIDLLIALHACDTATDDAIYRGITSGAKVIICAPCCHKQVRKDMQPTNELDKIMRFGILKERQAEIATDGIRSLIMEAYGYKTKVFEFIATEHTPKNILIVGVKQQEVEQPDAEVLAQIDKIKATYGIQKHYLETLMSGEEQ